jgi:probable F420-dependent oxidoreductase
VKFVLPTAFSPAEHYVPLAAAADAAGWDAVSVSDHVLHVVERRTPYPYTADGALRWEETAPWPDPWVAIGAMAAATARVRFFTNVYVLPMRNPFAAAKAIGTAAALSGGRVTLGIGVGWQREEFELLGADFATRGRRTDELVEILRRLWSGERVEFHGHHYDFGPVRMLPAPPGPVPIVLGGLSEPALRRAARLGDGWISDLHTTRELAEAIGRLRAYREECGRGAEPFEIFAACSDAFGVEGARRLEEVGVTHLLTLPWLFYGGATDRLDRKCLGIQRFADDVIAKLR